MTPEDTEDLMRINIIADARINQARKYGEQFFSMDISDWKIIKATLIKQDWLNDQLKKEVLTFYEDGRPSDLR